MSEHWFLDLDGVRSGPYQTSEVMSLVAEGEILPHHQIATDLKSQKWMTILEWRLNQNRNAEPKKEFIPEKVSETPKTQPIVPPVEPIESIQLEEKEELQKFVKEVRTPPPIASKPKSKRDPMAEMFDILQNTKQKREVKSQQSHAQAHSQSQAAPKNHVPNIVEKIPATKSNLGKTIFIGLIITIFGFALGQLFQQKKSSDSLTADTQNISKTVTTTPSTPAPVSTPEQMGTVDRSTEKMTIRAQVPVQAAATPSPTPEHTKDIQELRDLKKELLELKALKEEMHNNNDSGHMGNTPRSSDSNPEVDLNAEDAPVDSNGNPVNPSNDVHY